MLKKALFVILLAALVPMVGVAADKFEQNVNYFEVFPNYPGSEKGKVEVVEFFWYNCPHCKDFEPFLHRWLARKPQEAVFNQVPVIFPGRDGGPHPAGKLHAETFYALEMMGKLEALHGAIFSAIHEKGTKLDTADAMEAFLAKNGVDAEAFRATRQSFAVQTRVNRSIELARRYGVEGVPIMVIGGTYRTGPTGSFEEMTRLVDFLIAKVKDGQAVAK